MGERPLSVTKGANGLTASGKIDATDSIVAEDGRYPVFVRARDGATTCSLYWPAATSTASSSRASR